jgi:hypothetical protein
LPSIACAIARCCAASPTRRAAVPQGWCRCSTTPSLRGDGGGKTLATKKPVIGGIAVARFIVAVMRTLPAGASVEAREARRTRSGRRHGHFVLVT